MGAPRMRKGESVEAATARKAQYRQVTVVDACRVHAGHNEAVLTDLRILSDSLRRLETLDALPLHANSERRTDGYTATIVNRVTAHRSIVMAALEQPGLHAELAMVGIARAIENPAMSTGDRLARWLRRLHEARALRRANNHNGPVVSGRVDDHAECTPVDPADAFRTMGYGPIYTDHCAQLPGKRRSTRLAPLHSARSCEASQPALSGLSVGASWYTIMA